LRSILVSGPSHGTLVLNSDGSFTYHSHPGFAGYDYFQYKASDAQLESNVVTVRVEVIGPVFAPTAINDLYDAEPHLSTQVSADSGVLRNDLGPAGVMLTAVLFEGPSHGSLSLQADGSFTYQPVDLGGFFTRRARGSVRGRSKRRSGLDGRWSGRVTSRIVVWQGRQDKETKRPPPGRS